MRVNPIPEDRDRAQVALERIQRANLDGLGIDVEEDGFELPEPRMFEMFRTVSPDRYGGMTLEQFREHVTELRERFDRVRPSPFEHAGLFFVISNLLERIYEALDAMGIEHPDHPVFGTMRTGRVNGMAIAVDDTPIRIIIIEHGLFGFANLMCKAVAMAIPFMEVDNEKLKYNMNRDDILARLDVEPEPIWRFFDALMSYIVTGDPHNAKQYNPGPELNVLTSVLRDSMELFILGHELGHVFSGHLNGAIVRCALPGGVETFEISTDWKQEFEADLMGIAVSVNAQQREGYDLPLSYIGGDLFFACIDVVERATGILQAGSPTTPQCATHPPTPMRRAMLRLWLDKVVGESQPEQSHAALEFANLVDDIVEAFWEKVEPTIYELHKKGERPAPWFH